MAKKRKIKRRKGSRLRNPDSQTSTQTSTMSSEDSYALQSGRQSSEMMSDHVMSEGVNTGMTSIMDTDEELTDALEVDEDDDMISIYPAGHYGGARSIYRPAMPYLPEHSMAGDSDVAASTRSLWEQDLDYRDIHGRRYCREYFMPNDEIEQIRLTLNHQIFIHLLNDELTLAPLQDPTHILDVGTGTGEWAIRMAELWPHTEVVGTDIAAIAETRSVPMNVFFEIEDAEEWDRLPESYDLIHLRCMEGAFKNWRFIYDSIFYSLKPGGWIELQDFDSAEGFTQFVSSFPEGSLMSDLNNDLVTAATKCGRPRGTFFLEPRLFEEAGFVDIRVTEYVIPITVAEKSVGKIWLISCLDALEAYCLRLLTTYMGWDPERCKAACEATAREMAKMAKDPEASKGLQVKMRVVVARKPLDAPPAEFPPALDGYTSAPSMESFTDKRTLVDPVVTIHEATKVDMPGTEAQAKDTHGLSMPGEEKSATGGL